MDRKLLIIDDDPEIVKLLRTSGGRYGYEFDSASEGLKGLDLATSNSYLALILDVSLPDIDGLEICRQLRSQNMPLPILMLTSRTDEVDRVLGLELGADDYVVKPFSTRELFARVKAILRRGDYGDAQEHKSKAGKKVVCGELEVDLRDRRVRLRGKNIELTALEFTLLEFLVTHRGRTFSRHELMESVWGYQASAFEQTITTQLSRLRSKIELDPSNPRYIKTIRGIGYRFVEEEALNT